jgi:hypothetical protein
MARLPFSGTVWPLVRIRGRPFPDPDPDMVPSRIQTRIFLVSLSIGYPCILQSLEYQGIFPQSLSFLAKVIKAIILFGSGIRLF